MKRIGTALIFGLVVILTSFVVTISIYGLVNLMEILPSPWNLIIGGPVITGVLLAIAYFLFSND